MKTTILLFLSLLLTTFTLAGQTRLVKVEGDLRQFTIYKPSSVTDSVSVPLLLNFHGHGMTSGEQMLYSRTNELAERDSFIVVYPQGVSNDWNVGFEQDYDGGEKDVAFIKTLIEKLQKHYPIDPDRIYAVGISRGGFFVQRLVSELPNTFKGIVSVGAPMPVEVYKRMPDSVQLKVMYVHGDKDQIVDMNGDKENYLSLQESVAYWKNRNEANSSPKENTFDTVADDTEVEFTSYQGKKDTGILRIKNGGHTWPGADAFNIGLPLGKTTQDIVFNEFFWNFLK